MIRRRGRAPTTLVLLAALWLAAVCNLPLWRALAQRNLLDSAAGWLLVPALGCAVVVGTLLLLAPVAGSRAVRPALALLLPAAAAASHFSWHYGTVFDAGMAANLLQTDWHEAADLLDAGLLASVLLGGALPALWLWRQPLDARPWPRRLLLHAAVTLVACLAAVLLALAAFQPLAAAMRNHKDLRYLINPLHLAYAGARQLAAGRHGAPQALRAVAPDAHLAAGAGRPLLLVLVVGETGRAGNFGLNGYARDTTPELAAARVASWRDVSSCGTSTAVSVPCMFSHLGRAGLDQDPAAHENLLDVLQRAGLAVLWLDNQGGCKGVCARVASATTTGEDAADLCRGGECLDEILLRGLDARIAALPAEGRARGTVLVLHPIGSHGPAYYRRSPAASKRFLPECASTRLTDCSQAELVNAYDNSIAYTDHLLASTIAWLHGHAATHDTALVYVADHGESLGENHLYLHGLPWALAPAVQKHVPWISWLSAQYEERTGLATDCLQRLARRPVSHDHFFHSVLGLAQVRTAAYDASLDAYSPCRPADGSADIQFGRFKLH